MFVLNVRINKKKFIKVFTIITIILILILFIFVIKNVIIPVSKNNMTKINVSANSIENNCNDNNKKDLKSSREADYKDKETDNTNNKNNEILEIKTSNFTTFLKNCNENIDSYVGKTINISGFVYRLSDFTKNQFVVARLMPIHYQSATNKKSNYIIKLESNNKSNLRFYNEADIKKFNLSLNIEFPIQLLAERTSDDNCVVVGILCEGNNLSDFKSNSWVDITGEINIGNYNGKIPIIKVTHIKQIDSNPNELFVEQPQ